MNRPTSENSPLIERLFNLHLKKILVWKTLEEATITRNVKMRQELIIFINEKM
jgi:hypothetical protein